MVVAEAAETPIPMPQQPTLADRVAEVQALVLEKQMQTTVGPIPAVAVVEPGVVVVGQMLAQAAPAL